MGAEDLPLAGAETLQHGGALRGAQRGIRIHGGHQDRGILVVGCLLPGHAVYVHIDIPGESQVVLIVNQDGFSRQMAAFALVYLKVQLPEIKEARLFQRVGLFALGVPQRNDLFRFRRLIERQRLADADIGFMERVLLPETVFAEVLQFQAFPGFPAGIDPVKQRQQAGIIIAPFAVGLKEGKLARIVSGQIMKRLLVRDERRPGDVRSYSGTSSLNSFSISCRYRA